jgi:hypothetical protein
MSPAFVKLGTCWLLPESSIFKKLVYSVIPLNCCVMEQVILLNFVVVLDGVADWSQN